MEFILVVYAEEAVGEGGNGNSCRCLLFTESVVRLTIMAGAVMNDVGTVLRSPGRCGEGGKGGEGEEGIGTPAGVCACVCDYEGASNIASASVMNSRPSCLSGLLIGTAD